MSRTWVIDSWLLRCHSSDRRCVPACFDFRGKIFFCIINTLWSIHPWTKHIILTPRKTSHQCFHDHPCKCYCYTTNTTGSEHFRWMSSTLASRHKNNKREHDGNKQHHLDTKKNIIIIHVNVNVNLWCGSTSSPRSLGWRRSSSSFHGQEHEKHHPCFLLFAFRFLLLPRRWKIWKMKEVRGILPTFSRFSRCVLHFAFCCHVQDIHKGRKFHPRHQLTAGHHYHCHPHHQVLCCCFISAFKSKAFMNAFVTNTTQRHNTTTVLSFFLLKIQQHSNIQQQQQKHQRYSIDIHSFFWHSFKTSTTQSVSILLRWSRKRWKDEEMKSIWPLVMCVSWQIPKQQQQQFEWF